MDVKEAVNPKTTERKTKEQEKQKNGFLTQNTGGRTSLYRCAVGGAEFTSAAERAAHITKMHPAVAAKAAGGRQERSAERSSKAESSRTSPKNWTNLATNGKEHRVQQAKVVKKFLNSPKERCEVRTTSDVKHHASFML